MLKRDYIVDELNTYSIMELIKLYNACSEDRYMFYNFNDTAIKQFTEEVVEITLTDFIGMVMMSNTYNFNADEGNVFYMSDDDVIHVCGVKDIKVPFDEVINKAMTNKEFFKNIDFHFYIFLVEKDK